MKVRVFRVVAMAALVLAATPAAAQHFSDSYEFLEAVRKADGNKVNTFLQDKTLRIVNTKDRNTGEQKELTEWHRISFFGRLAEIVGQYLKKGSSVYVEGRLQTRKYTDKDGVEKYATDIIAENMQMLGGRQGMGEGGGMDDGGSGGSYDSAPSRPAPRPAPPTPAARPAPKPAPNFSDMDDDIPF